MKCKIHGFIIPKNEICDACKKIKEPTPEPLTHTLAIQIALNNHLESLRYCKILVQESRFYQAHVMLTLIKINLTKYFNYNSTQHSFSNGVLK